MAYTRSKELQASFDRAIIDDCKTLTYLENFEEEYRSGIPYEMRSAYTYEALTRSAITLHAYIKLRSENLGCDFDKCMEKAKAEVENETKQMKKEVA